MVSTACWVLFMEVLDMQGLETPTSAGFPCLLLCKKACACWAGTAQQGAGGHLLNPGEEALLELISIAAQHVAGIGLVIQQAGPDADLGAAHIQRLHLPHRQWSLLCRQPWTLNDLAR